MTRMPVRNPRSGVADYSIDVLDKPALTALAAELRQRQTAWAALPPEARSDHLRALAGAIRQHRSDILAALTTDTGRGTASAIEADSIPALIERWAGAAPAIIAHASPPTRPSATPGIEVTARLVPYGLVGVISPWNFPLILALIDAIPALAAGAAVIVKPSEVTPRFLRPLMAAIATVPAVPLALIEGDGATGAALIDVVDYVAFTGSVATGRKVAAAAAHAFIPASLELGGKDPMIVLASADPVRAAGVALRASVVNTGQACQSIERVYVQRAIAAPFMAALVAQAQAVRLNTSDVGSGDIGPFIFERQAAIVQAQIDDAVASGATLLAGGKVENHGGLWLKPTVLADVTADMAIMREETFGPVIPVTVFDTVEEAIGLANDSAFGLSAAVLAATAGEAERVAVHLKAGAVSINDGSLTAMVWDAEKNSFGASGLGPSRMGDSGLLRFFRHQALLRQTGTPLPLAAYAEDARRP